MSPLHVLCFFLFLPSFSSQKDDLLNKLKSIDDRNDLWDLLKTVGKIQPVDVENDEELDDLFASVEEDDELFNSVESQQDVSTETTTVYTKQTTNTNIPMTPTNTQGNTNNDLIRGSTAAVIVRNTSTTVSPYITTTISNAFSTNRIIRPDLNADTDTFSTRNSPATTATYTNIVTTSDTPQSIDTTTVTGSDTSATIYVTTARLRQGSNFLTTTDKNSFTTTVSTTNIPNVTTTIGNNIATTSDKSILSTTVIPNTSTIISNNPPTNNLSTSSTTKVNSVVSTTTENNVATKPDISKISTNTVSLTLSSTTDNNNTPTTEESTVITTTIHPNRQSTNENHIATTKDLSKIGTTTVSSNLSTDSNNPPFTYDLTTSTTTVSSNKSTTTDSNNPPSTDESTSSITNLSSTLSITTNSNNPAITEASTESITKVIPNISTTTVSYNTPTTITIFGSNVSKTTDSNKPPSTDVSTISPYVSTTTENNISITSDKSKPSTTTTIPNTSNTGSNNPTSTDVSTTSSTNASTTTDSNNPASNVKVSSTITSQIRSNVSTTIENNISTVTDKSKPSTTTVTPITSTTDRDKYSTTSTTKVSSDVSTTTENIIATTSDKSISSTTLIPNTSTTDSNISSSTDVSKTSTTTSSSDVSTTTENYTATTSDKSISSTSTTDNNNSPSIDVSTASTTASSSEVFTTTESIIATTSDKSISSTTLIPNTSTTDSNNSSSTDVSKTSSSDVSTTTEKNIATTSDTAIFRTTTVIPSTSTEIPSSTTVANSRKATTVKVTNKSIMSTPSVPTASNSIKTPRFMTTMKPVNKILSSTTFASTSKSTTFKPTRKPFVSVPLTTRASISPKSTSLMSTKKPNINVPSSTTVATMKSTMPTSFASTASSITKTPTIKSTQKPTQKNPFLFIASTSKTTTSKPTEKISFTTLFATTFASTTKATSILNTTKRTLISRPDTTVSSMPSKTTTFTPTIKSTSKIQSATTPTSRTKVAPTIKFSSNPSTEIATTKRTLQTTNLRSTIKYKISTTLKTTLKPKSSTTKMVKNIFTNMTRNKKISTTTAKIETDLLPPPPLPPLPPLPKVQNNSTRNKHPMHRTSFPKLKTTTFRTLLDLLPPPPIPPLPPPPNKLHEQNMFIIPDDDVPSNKGSSLLPQRKFLIPPEISNSSVTSTARSTKHNVDHAKGHRLGTPSCSTCNQVHQNTLEIPSSVFHIVPKTDYDRLPNTNTQYRIIIPNQSSIRVSNSNKQVLFNPQVGDFQLRSLAKEHDTQSNVNSDHGSLVYTKNKPINIGPFILSRSDTNTNHFVKPKFDFMITNKSDSNGGSLQIRPIVRSSDPKNVLIRFNPQVPYYVKHTELHSPGRNVVMRISPPFPHLHSNANPREIYRRSRRAVPDLNSDVQGTSLVFVFDVTGSMASELRQVQQQASKLAKAMTDHPDKPIYEYIFVPFNDPAVGPVTKTRDHGYFQDIVDGVHVDGGGDCPEMSMKALVLALENSLPRSYIYVFTDADAKDKDLQEKVLSLVQKKNSMIFFLLTGKCYSSYDVVYETISTTSGGQVYDLEKTNVNDVLEYIKGNLNSRKVNIMSINSNEAALQPKPYPMPVDGLLEEISVSVSGKNPKLSIYEPGGSLAVPPRVKDMLTLPNLKVVNVPSPEPGEWTIKVGSDSAHSLRTTGLSKSDVKIAYGFSVIPTNDLSETAHRPLKGAMNSILVKTHLPVNECNLTHISLIDFEGQVIGIIKLTPVDFENGLYSGGPVLLPSNDYFNLEAHGYDLGGNKLVRMFPSAIAPQSPELPEITVKPFMSGVIGDRVELECYFESLVPITVKWYKDGRILSSEEYQQSSKAILQIPNVTRQSAGNYTCWCKNIAGIATNHIILSIAEPPVVFVRSDVRHHLNNAVKLSCRVESLLDYNVTWSRKISRQYEGETEEELSFSSKSTRDDPHHDFVINQVKNEHEGWYTCTATNKVNSTRDETYLHVLGPPVLYDAIPVQFDGKVPLVITCKLKKLERFVKFIWEKKDSQIKSDHITVDGDENNNYAYQLIIYNPDRTDEGFYRCIASNKFGSETKTVRVSYVSLPKIRAVEKQIFVREGKSANLRCIISDGIPSPNVTWFKQDIQIKNYPPHMKSSENGAALVIGNITESDSSNYYCVAQNEAGEDRALVELQIGIEPKIISPLKNRRREVEYSGSLDIPCKASGNPSPIIIWAKTSPNILYKIYQNTLEIRDANFDDEGEYTCSAKNMFGQDEVIINVSLIGLEKPVISGSEMETPVKGLVGQKLELQCVLLSGNPLPKISWFKNGVRLAPSLYNVVLTNGSFIIPLLTLRHVGSYECLAQNEVGEDRKRYSLSTYDAPKMNLSLSSFVLSKVGANVTLPCHIRGDPQPVVTWHKENSLHNRPFKGLRVNGSDNLYLHNITEEDSGRYICKAENIAGIARKAVVLSVISPPRILSFPSEVSSVSGEEVFISCPTVGTPRPVLHWLKNGQPLLHVRGSIGNNYLRFYSSPSDAGEYTCIAENKAGDDRASTTLLVFEPPRIEDLLDTRVEGIVGKGIELPCLVSGTPRPIVIWQHKGHTIKKIIPSVNSSVGLFIDNVSEEDKGSYICIASNKAGSNRKIIELSVLTPPSIEDWSGPVRVIPGDTVTVECKVSGFPKPAVSWTKSGQLLPPEFFTHDNILRFIVESSHSGNYTCKASNKAGTDAKDVFISVYEAPTFLLEEREDLEILQGSDVRVSCSAKGDPKPVISWFYNGRILENKSNIRFLQDKDVMFIKEIDEQESGIYECAATNKAGTNSRSIKINVLVPPKISRLSDGMSVKEGNEVILNCEVSGKPEPVVVWRKNSVPLPSEFSYRGNKIRFIATATDQGNYSCHASNKVGNDVKYTSLMIKVHPQIEGDLEEDVIALWNDSIELLCLANGVPQPSITWIFNKTSLTNLPNAEYELKGSNLFIPKVEHHNAGLYICLANNSLGTAQKTLSVTVHVPPQIIDDSQNEVSLKEGDDFSISCLSYGVPTPDIVWVKNDKMFKKGYHDEHYVVMNDYTLIISNAQLNMSGTYVCISSNVEGSATKNYSIDIVVSTKDTILESGNVTVIEIEESDDGVLNCPLTDLPISWLKDDDGIDSGKERADDIHLQLLNSGRTLKLAEAYSTDSGLYTCYTDLGETTQFLVRVLVRPYFLQEFPQTDFELTQGDQLTLDCNAAGYPTPKINWRHLEKDMPITKHTVPGVLVKGDDKDTLHFPAVRPHHAGRYMCLASNKVGKEGRVFSLKVTEPPLLDGGREEKITVIAGNALDLLCTISGSPKPRYSWKHISSTGKETTMKYNQKTFIMNNVKSDDGGIYICNGTNKVGSTVKYFFLYVLEAPVIKGERLDEVQLAEGRELELECEAFGVPVPSLTWEFESRQVDTARAIITSNKPQTNNTLSSTLRIKSVDRTVAGLYSCLASNDVATTQKHFRLSIIVPPVLSDQSFIFINKSMEVNEGQVIYLSCPVRRDNPLNIEWYLTVNGTRKSVKNYNNDNLYVASARSNDSGLYTCVANNSAGTVEASFIISISEPPVFVSSHYEKSIILKQDDELILNCSVTSTPRSQIVWLKDGVRITGKTSHLTFLNHNQTLVISEVNAGDSGKYICIASNRAGSVERSYHVTVHEAPKVAAKLADQVSMETNRTDTHFSRVVLRCPLTGSPQPTIEWYKDGSLLSEGIDRIHISPLGSKLIIFYLTEEDAGRYSCKAQNQAGINQLFFNLNVIVNLEWTNWSDWSSCSKVCDNGVQTRNRMCGVEPALKFKQSSYIQYDKSKCEGSSGQTRVCNTHPCKIDGGWGGWSEWGSCSVSCGPGKRTRSRKCDSPEPAFGGDRCKGSSVDASNCTRPPCPIDGQWSGWTEWSECTVSCGGGLKFRERRCNSPPPQEGGKPCPGSYRDVVLCNQQKCSIDGRWTGWSKWSECSVSCGMGTQARYRQCYKPLYGGKPCDGSNKQTRICENASCNNEAVPEALRRSEREMSREYDTLNYHGTTDRHSLSLEETERNREWHDSIEKDEQLSSKTTYLSEVKSDHDANHDDTVDGFTEKSFYRKPVTLLSNDSNALLSSDEVRAHFKTIKCPSGYRYSKTTNRCRDINECMYRKWNRCGRSRSKCVNTVGSYQCICPRGYRLQIKPRKKCIDINECKEEKANCSHFCHNTRGSYSCSCPDSLTLHSDRHSCFKDYPDYSSDDETLLSGSSDSGWSINSDAVKFEDDYQNSSDDHNTNQLMKKVEKIVCPKGFIERDEKCEDINECAMELHSCTAEQICMNTFGYYLCYDAPCPLGYDLVPAIRSCQYDCKSNRCSTDSKIAETLTYETYDVENKTISSLQDIILLVAYNENKMFINNTVYNITNNDKELPIDVRKENNLGLLYATQDFFVNDINRVNVVGISKSENSSDILYTSQFVILIYNSFTLTDFDLH